MNFRAPLVALLLIACKREPASPQPRPHNTPGASVGGSGSPTPPVSAVDAPASASAFREAGQYLPQGTPMAGWTQSGAVRLVNGQDLFQLIDGAGEKYMAYGFRQLARTDYRKAGSTFVVTAEVYDMGSTLGAFGQYSMMLSDGRDPSTLEPQATPHGGGGFLGTSQLVFWKGQYLVQLNLNNENDDGDEAALRAVAREALPPLAQRMAESLPGDIAAPAPPTGFPREGVVWGGLTWLAQNVFGVDRSGAGWVGHYRSAEGKRWRLAVLVRPDASAAHTTATSFRSGTAAAIANLGDEAFSVTGAAGELLVARKGVSVVVIADAGVPELPAPTRDARLATLRAVVAALP